MNPKNLIVNGIRAIPRVRRYLDEKHQMKVIINELNSQNQGLIKAMTPKKCPVINPIFRDDILLAQSHGPQQKLRRTNKGKLLLNWVVPAFSASSGGLTDIYRTISYLESSGHNCRVYIYDRHGSSNLKQQESIISANLPHLKASLFYNSSNMLDCDAIIATNWPSAYPVYNFKGIGKKYYYVQDFEPFFEPEGAMRDFAENTYKFGLHGLTLGEWLSEKLAKEYRMICESFDLGYDPDDYFMKNKAKRKDILFYAQPEKARRGFELGIMALELFHEENPDTKIHLFGSNLSNYKFNFPFIDHGILSREKINDLYNECAAGLVLSFTNISLTPLEMLAAGCIPIMNEAYHNRKIKFADKVIYAEPTPRGVSKALGKSLLKAQPKGIASIKRYEWEIINSNIENILIRDLA